MNKSIIDTERLGECLNEFMQIVKENSICRSYIVRQVSGEHTIDYIGEICYSSINELDLF